MYTYTKNEARASARVVIPITSAQILVAGVITRPSKYPWDTARIEMLVEYDFRGVRLAFIGLFAQTHLRDKNGAPVWDIISAQYNSRFEKATYQRSLRHLAQSVLGEAEFAALMAQIQGDFPSWLD